jgi:hypothetical protein
MDFVMYVCNLHIPFAQYAGYMVNLYSRCISESPGEPLINTMPKLHKCESVGLDDSDNGLSFFPKAL